MHKEDAEQLSQLLARYSEMVNQRYFLEKHKGDLSGIPGKARNLPIAGAYFIKDRDNDNIILFLLSEWQRGTENYYIVLFYEGEYVPIVEMHTLKDVDGEKVLHWHYSPSKRDEKNEERKAYFSDIFISGNVQISFPNEIDEVEDFIGEIISLVNCRTKADNLDPERPNVRNGFPEGKRKERLHYYRERNRELILKAKNRALNRSGRLQCACCGFDFFETYGEVGKYFIEAHHTKPVSALHADGEETMIEDIALVCSNCHRMLHRRRPWLEINELSSLLLKDRS